MLPDREQLLSTISGNTLRFRIKAWIDNFQANQDAIHGRPGVAELGGLFEGLPAAVVGSGPTLDRNIKDIHMLKDKCLLIACDSAVKALEKFNAHPDIVMVTDSKARVADFLRGIDVDRYTFVADTFIHPDTVEVLKDAKRLYWYSTLPIESCPFTGALNEWTGYIGNLGTGGCVATTAWWMASRVFLSDPTILIGLPQAFYDPANMYSQEVNNTVETEPYESHLVETHDIFGKPCYTYPALQSFAYWFQDAFLQIPGIHINCSEGGILQENCLNMPLIGAIQKYLHQDFNVDETLFVKEYMVDQMLAALGDAHELDDYKTVLQILMGGPSLSNLSARLGKFEAQGEVLDMIEGFQKKGFVIEETESPMPLNPDGTPSGPAARVFMLKGLQVKDGEDVTLDMQIERVENRPVMTEIRAVNLEPDAQALLARMQTGLPPMVIDDLANISRLSLEQTGEALKALMEQKVVVELPSEDGSELGYVLAAMLPPEAIPATPPIPEPPPVPETPVEEGRYVDTATNPGAVDAFARNLVKKQQAATVGTGATVSRIDMDATISGGYEPAIVTAPLGPLNATEVADMEAAHVKARQEADKAVGEKLGMLEEKETNG